MHINVKIICPICKVDRIINIPKRIINQSKQLSTVSIPRGTICKHHFQVFIDKNFSIRGYQKVDFELNTSRDSKHINLTDSDCIKKKLTLDEIYNEFWEFIDDNNEIFQTFISKDKKRRSLLVNSFINVPKNHDLLDNIQKN